MQPDRPQLCRFWLAGLISALNAAADSLSPVNVFMPLAALASFLWHYTWAAVPEPLRAPLVLANDKAEASVRRERDARDGDLIGYANMMVTVIRSIILANDQTYRAWRKGKGRNLALIVNQHGSGAAPADTRHFECAPVLHCERHCLCVLLLRLPARAPAPPIAGTLSALLCHIANGTACVFSCCGRQDV